MEPDDVELVVEPVEDDTEPDPVCVTELEDAEPVAELAKDEPEPDPVEEPSPSNTDEELVNEPELVDDKVEDVDDEAELKEVWDPKADEVDEELFAVGEPVCEVAVSVLDPDEVVPEVDIVVEFVTPWGACELLCDCVDAPVPRNSVVEFCRESGEDVAVPESWLLLLVVLVVVLSVLN